MTWVVERASLDCFPSLHPCLSPPLSSTFPKVPNRWFSGSPILILLHAEICPSISLSAALSANTTWGGCVCVYALGAQFSCLLENQCHTHCIYLHRGRKKKFQCGLIISQFKHWKLPLSDTLPGWGKFGSLWSQDYKQKSPHSWVEGHHRSTYCLKICRFSHQIGSDSKQTWRFPCCHF